MKMILKQLCLFFVCVCVLYSGLMLFVQKREACVEKGKKRDGFKMAPFFSLTYKWNSAVEKESVL